MIRKNIIRTIIMAIGVFLLLNGVVMLVFANSNIGNWLTALIGLCFVLSALFTDFIKLILQRSVFKFLLAFVLLAVVLAVLTSAILFVYGNANNVNYKEDYLIVLGCGVNGEEPTAPLVSRLDTALEYSKRNGECKIIVTGGQGNGEDITEAEAMYRYLVQNGVAEERIIKEEEATSTTENFKYSNRLVDGGLGSYSVAFVTNDFHVYRANSLARYQGFKVNHIGAPTVWYNVVPSYLRELLAIVQMYVFRR